MRTVQLTDEQAKQFNLSFRKSNLIKERLPALINHLLEHVIEQEEECWDDLYQVCEADKGKEILTFNYRTGIVTITPREEQTNE